MGIGGAGGRAGVARRWWAVRGLTVLPSSKNFTLHVVGLPIWFELRRRAFYVGRGRGVASRGRCGVAGEIARRAWVELRAAERSVMNRKCGISSVFC